MTGQEYIQRQINLVKQQIKGSKVKIIVTDIDPVTKFKKLQYDFYENELQTLESIEKSLKALEIIKEKRVDIEKIIFYGNVEDYNNSNVYKTLTPEEYETIKEVIE